jgi:hypothetical protein
MDRVRSSENPFSLSSQSIKKQKMDEFAVISINTNEEYFEANILETNPTSQALINYCESHIPFRGS